MNNIILSDLISFHKLNKSVRQIQIKIIYQTDLYRVFLSFSVFKPLYLSLFCELPRFEKQVCVAY